MVFAFGRVMLSAVRVKLYAGVSVEPLLSPAQAPPVWRGRGLARVEAASEATTAVRANIAG